VRRGRYRSLPPTPALPLNGGGRSGPWLLTIGAALAALILAAAWLLPSVLDWNRYRDTVAALASDTLGRSVRIDGPIALTLLPRPMLTADRVSVPASATDIAVSVARLSVVVSLRALLSGRINARELVLQGADIRIPWPVNTTFAPPRARLALSARIEGGRLTLGSALFTGIDATLTTGDYTGSYVLAGNARAPGDQPWRFNARLTPPGADGSAALDVALDGDEAVRGVRLSLSAQVAGDGSLAGRIAAYGPDLSRLLPAPAQPFRAEGRLTIAGGLAAADELAIDLGSTPARGAVALRLAPVPRLDLALAASRLDLDAWAPVLFRTPAPGALRLPIGIDLSAEAAQLAGGLLRGLRVAFQLDGGNVELPELTAVLPGEANLRAAGRMTTTVAPPGAPPGQRFEGFVALAAPALRTTLAWLQPFGLPPVAQLPPGVLHAATVAGHAIIEPSRFAIDGITGALDDAPVSGSFGVNLGPRPGVVASLAVDRLDLDAWLPGGPPDFAAIRTRIGTFDAEVQATVKRVVLRGATIGPLALDGRIEAGRADIRKLALADGAASVAASGIITEDGRIEKARIDLRAPEAAMLAKWLPDSFAFLAQRAPALWQAPVALSVLADGAPESLGVRVTASAGDLGLEAMPTLDLATGTWAGTLTLRHPGASRLAEALGLAEAAGWVGEGSFSLVAQVSGARNRLAADRFDLAAGATRLHGTLAVERAERGARVTGQLAAESLGLPLPLAHAPDPLPVGLLQGWGASVKLAADQVLFGLAPLFQHLDATVAVADGALRVTGLSAKLGGGTLRAGLSFDARAEPPAAALDASLTGATLSGPPFGLPVDLSGGVIDATVSLTAAGHSPAALLATLGGSAGFSVRDGTLAGIDLDRVGGDLPDEAIATALSGGSMGFDRMDLAARVDHGSLRISQAALRAASGTMGMTGSIDLAGATGDLRLALRPAVPDPPEIGLRLNGPLDAMRRIPELAAVVRWRAGARGATPPPAATP
jgi:hypothetical protein